MANTAVNQAREVAEVGRGQVAMATNNQDALSASLERQDQLRQNYMKNKGGLFGAGAQSSANKANLQIARENNAANQQLQRDQNKWNLEQWNRENEYNSASSQRQRLQAAGYNPALAVGQVATGSATSNQLQSAPYTPNVS